MTQLVNPEFGALRSLFWPIHRHELKKMLPMLLMLFLICFNYTILRNMKDAVVITAAGAEILPFIKVWVLLPMAVVVTLIFTKISNIFSQERVFYIMISAFLIFYALFAFLLYPLREVVEFNHSADYLQSLLPAGFKGMIAMYRHWLLTTFYVGAELWSTAIMSVLFWGFANEVTRIHEARRFYGTFGIASNFAAIAAGQLGIFCSQHMGFIGNAWEKSVMMLTTIVIISGIITMCTFRWVNRYVLVDPSFDDFHMNKREIKKKGRLTLRESFSYLSNSKYLICIAILVVSYNLVINLVEVVWKDQLRYLYSSPKDYNTYINNLTSIQGVVSTFAALFMAKFISRFGWTCTALVTPLTMLVTSAGFFCFMFFQNHLSDTVIMLTGTTPLAIAVFFGSAQNCLSKAAKYSFFDTTKEMAFIPLSHECKLKGKAAIDGVGSRLGKSGGSLIHQGLLMFFGNLVMSAPYVASILLVVIIFWFVACRSLGRQFNDLVRSQETQQADQAPSEPAQTQPAVPKAIVVSG
ncbi:Probable ADP/ATP translocase [Neochlamydia sp. S13]|nr:Npt1/Npt2 family nucleotide transporter [Neochlamydia sp. S13]BBI17559.1 Probable ADP/ATP translocase [Neochlamydia sp. S13]